MAFVKAPELRITQGTEALTDYRYTPPKMSGPFLHLYFCRHCGVRAFTGGGALPQFGGEFYAVNVACLDDATDDELAQAPIHFADGRHDDWDATAEHRYLLPRSQRISVMSSIQKSKALAGVFAAKTMAKRLVGSNGTGFPLPS